MTLSLLLNSYMHECMIHKNCSFQFKMYYITATLWGFLHLKSELIREAENQKTDKNQRKTVKYGSIFEGEITKQLKK